jgi:hypothetical protein
MNPAAEVPCYLTRSPDCSRTPPPDVPALADYIFEGKFHNDTPRSADGGHE